MLRLSDHENKRFYNDEEDITFVPENSLKSIRKKNHRKRYKKKHGNQQYRKWSEKPNNVSAFLFKFVLTFSSLSQSFIDTWELHIISHLFKYFIAV